MKAYILIAATTGACIVAGVASAQTQYSPTVCASRVAPDRQAACVEFLDKHMWDEGKTAWVLKPGKTYSGSMPKGMMTPEEVRAARTKFLAENKWDEGKSAWVPIAGKPREVCEDKACTKTRAEVQADNKAFLRTHRFDEGKGMYVAKQ